MRKNYFSIAKLFLMGAVVAAGATFTSCSDRDDLAEATTETTGQMYNGDVFTYHNDKDGDLTIKINGTDAVVTRGTEPGTAVNAKLVYDDPVSGHLEMTDNTLSVNNIPFVKSKSILQLKFNGTGIFSDCSVFLRNNGTVTRAASADAIGKEVVDILTDVNFSSMFGTLVTSGLTCLGGNIASSIFSMVWQQYFPTQSQNVEFFDNLNVQLDDLDAHLTNLEGTLRNDNLREAFKDHQKYISDLSFAVLQLKENTDSSTDKDFINNCYKEFATTTIGDHGQISVGLSTMMSNYINGNGEKSTFEKVDEFLINCYPFLSQSTESRRAFRIHDVKTFHEASQCMYHYFTEVNPVPKGVTEIETALKTFDDYMAQNGDFKQFGDTLVCTIDGAQFLMKDTVGTQVFGKNTFTQHNSDGNYYFYDTKFLDDMQARGNLTYFYSEGNFMSGGCGTELLDTCLTKKEAEALYNFYGGSKTLYEILSEGNLKGLDDPNQIMLLTSSGCSNAVKENKDFMNQCYTDLSMQAPVWDNANKKFNDSYQVGYIKNRLVDNHYLAYHYSVHPAYYAQVIKRFSANPCGLYNLTANESYEEFMKLVRVYMPLDIKKTIDESGTAK